MAVADDGGDGANDGAGLFGSVSNVKTAATQTGFSADVIVVDVANGKVVGQPGASIKYTGHVQAAPNPATCGLYEQSGVQHCQCTCDTGPLIFDYGLCQTEPTTPGTPQPPAEAAVLAAGGGPGSGE